MSLTPRPVLAAALLAAATLLAGCGSEDPGSAAASSTPSASTSASSSPTSSGSASAEPAADAPDCSGVWVEGEELPRRYTGCAEGEDLIATDTLGCSSGQQMIRYDDRFYGVAGGTVHQADTALEEDRAYRKAVAICRG